MRRKESKRGKLVGKWDERVDVAKLKDPHYWRGMPRKGTRGCGIYVLFDSKGLYYVGLTDTSLRRRIEKHTKNEHKEKWTRFSFYQLRRAKYTKDLETILLRIFAPPGNIVKGRLPSKLKLSKILEAKEAARRQRRKKLLSPRWRAK